MAPNWIRPHHRNIYSVGYVCNVKCAFMSHTTCVIADEHLFTFLYLVTGEREADFSSGLKS